MSLFVVYIKMFGLMLGCLGGDRVPLTVSSYHSQRRA